MKLKLTASHKFYLTLGLILVTLGVFSYFLPYYLFGKIRDSANRIKEARLEIALAEERLSGSRRSEELLVDRAAELKKINEHFFSLDDSLRAIEAVEGIGRMSPTETEINVLEAKDGIARFRLIASGGYPEVVRFVRMVENAPIYFDVESLWLERAAPVSAMAASSAMGKTQTDSASKVRATLIVKVASLK